MSKIPRSNYAKVPRRVAFHEAGHAVARVILGLPFEAVSVRKKPEEIMIIENGQEKYFDAIFNEGVILSQQLSDNIKEERLEGKLDLRDGISSMAGPDAEAMLIGERDEKAQEGALTDIIRITNSCRVAAEPGVPLEKLTHCEMENNIIQALSIQAIDLLKKNWTAVEAVAKELMKREYLSYSEVVELVNQAAPMAAKD